jgi:hypothetical protein
VQYLAAGNNGHDACRSSGGQLPEHLEKVEVQMKHFFSPHELATLVLLLSAPTQVSLNNPHLIALEQDNLVEMVAAENTVVPRVTDDGVLVLRRLGMTG